jgi:hypothetical protein
LAVVVSVEGAQGRRRPQRDRFGLLQGKGFGHQLAQHRVDETDQREAQAQRQRLDRESCPPAKGSNVRLDDVGQSRLAEPAKRQRCQGDAELIGGQERIEMVRDP